MHEASVEKVSYFGVTMENHGERKRGRTQMETCGPSTTPSSKPQTDTERKLNKRPKKHCCSNPTTFEGNAITVINIYKCFFPSHLEWRTKLTFYFYKKKKNTVHFHWIAEQNTFSPSKWPTKIPQFVTSTRSPQKAFQKLAKRGALRSWPLRIKEICNIA